MIANIVVAIDILPRSMTRPMKDLKKIPTDNDRANNLVAAASITPNVNVFKYSKSIICHLIHPRTLDASDL